MVRPRRFANTQDGGVYRCPNGLYEAAAPIRIQGEHIANLYMGQFLQGPPNMTFFINQARKYGFDEIAYLQALLRVPVFPQKKVTMVLSFFSRLAALIGEMGLRRIELMETNASLRGFRAALPAGGGKLRRGHHDRPGRAGALRQPEGGQEHRRGAGVPQPHPRQGPQESLPIPATGPGYERLVHPGQRAALRMAEDKPRWCASQCQRP
jgi:hypothetical protein